MDVLKKMVWLVREWLYRADREGHRRALGRLARHLIPNAGTLIILGLFFVAQSAGAGPSAAPLAQGATKTLLSYQGTLTDKDGNPINGNVNMVFQLYHQAEGGTSFWKESYTGVDAVEVRDGQFHVLLGDLVALDPADLTDDLYLGITVNGEEMTPREKLVAVPYAMQALTVPDGSITTAKINVDANLDVHGHALRNVRDISAHGSSNFDIMYGQNNDLFIKSAATGGGVYIGASGGPVPLSVNGSLFVLGPDFVMHCAGRGDGGRALVHDLDDKLIINYAGDFAGGVRVDSNIDMAGHSIYNCGALTEANLQTPEELAADRVDRFSEGDVLCWSPENDRLEKCTAANDRLVQAVADPDGRPIVIGAEVVKVLGPVQAGDTLVASDTPGYAMVNNAPRPGTVIAQALEDFDSDQGLVKAMIRKF